MTDTYRDAIERHGKRGHLATGLPIKVGLMPLATAVGRLWRFYWRIGLTRDYLPAMATPDGRRWWTIAHWHRLQIGPLVVLWRTRSRARTR